MRVADRPTPDVVLDTVPMYARWPVRPVVAIAGRRPVLEYDDPAVLYDDAFQEYDEDAVPGFFDATCAMQGLETETGPPDDGFNFPAGRAVVQLDNRDGAWSRYNVDGTLAAYGPGFELAVWARHQTTGVESWLFRGTVTRWDDLGDTVEVEAFDAFTRLAQPVGTYTPGITGNTPPQRLETILAAAGATGIAHTFSPGDVTLTAQPTSDAPLEEMQTVVASDGGALFCDADGTLVSARRTWRAGRTDQTVVPVVSANVCTADIVAWDAVLSTSDTALADTVVLENVAKLRAQSPAGAPGVFVLTDTGQQWATQLEGDTLAAFILSAQAGARVNVDTFDLYLTDPLQDVWPAVDWRLFDRLRWLHDYRAAGGTLARLDVNVIVAAIGHSITPDGTWLVTVATTKAVGYNTDNMWDPPGDPYAWDTAGIVWGYQ